MADLAIILAGGMGKRLLPRTAHIPKALVPVGGLPITGILIEQLRKYGFTKIVLALHDRAWQIRKYFGNGSRWGVKLSYSIEETPLGTIGPIKKIRCLPRDFLILNCDVLCDLNFRRFLEIHRSTQSIITIASSRKVNVSKYGILKTGDNGLLQGFREKPKTYADVSMGIYAAHQGLLKYIPAHSFLNIDSLFHQLLIDRQYPAVYRHRGKWFDIGSEGDCSMASRAFEKNPKGFLFKSPKDISWPSSASEF